MLTSPPYGRSVHGQVTARPDRGVAKFDTTYSADPANLGRVNQPALLDALGEILVGCQQLLRPAGLLVLTARPYRHHDQLVDLPGQLTQLAEATGLVPTNATPPCWSGCSPTTCAPTSAPDPHAARPAGGPGGL